MRTSRLARDTARVVDALSPRKRNTRLASHAAQNALASEGDMDTTIPASNRKRKRGTNHHESPSRSRTATTVLEPNANESIAESVAKPKKAKRQPAKKVTGADGEIKIEPPPNWQEVYRNIQQMRALWPAPVDTMGCESLADTQRSPRDQRFQTLVALMLSSQTKDTVTSVAIKNLQDNLSGGFTLESVLAVKPERLNELISKVGFHNNKTKYIKATASILASAWNSDIPDTIEGLTSLPGVGPKMAYLCMSAAWGRDEGIGVDVHVHRITNLLAWHKTQTPEQTREALEAWLPRDKWHDINHLMVGFGQTYCPPVGRKCGECKLAENRLCPSAVVSKKSTTKITREEQVKTEPDGEVIFSEEVTTKVEPRVITAGDLADVEVKGENEEIALQDIEDIGLRRTRRSFRTL